MEKGSFLGASVSLFVKQLKECFHLHMINWQRFLYRRRDKYRTQSVQHVWVQNGRGGYCLFKSYPLVPLATFSVYFIYYLVFILQCNGNAGKRQI